MAEFGEPFELCKIFQKGCLVGIKKHFDVNYVILTLKDRGIQVYNLTDQKLVKSWSVEQHQDVTCAAVQDPTTKNFVTVVNNVELCMWTSDSPDLQHCKKFLLEKPVKELCVDMEDDHEPVVVFKDSSVAKLSECMQSKADNSHSSKRFKATVETDISRLFWCDTCRHNKKTFVILLYCATSQQQHKLDILSLEQEKGRRLLVSCQLQPPQEDVRILACTMLKAQPELVTLWSCGSLCISDLSSVLCPSSGEAKITCQYLSCRILQNISHFSSSPSEGCVSIASIDSSNVCLCDSSLVNKNLEDTVSVWNTKYGTLQGKRSISKLRDSSSSSAILRQSPGVEHLCCTAGYICVGVPCGVGVCPVDVKASSLANALGRLGAPLEFSSEPSSKCSLLSTPRLVKPWKLQKWCKELASEDIAEREVLSKLISPEMTPTHESFSTELHHYVHSKTVKASVSLPPHVPHSIGSTPEVGDKLESQNCHHFSQHFVTCLLRRCLTEDQFWPQDCLDLLVQTKCIPASESTELIKALIEKNEMDLMIKCFKNIKGIPEAAIVSCLQYILSCDGEQVPTGDASSEPMDLDIDVDILRHEQSPVEPVKGNYLCTILHYPVNDVFIQDSLKLLDFKNALKLLKFLHYLMRHSSQLLSPTEKEEDGKLHFVQVLDWTSLLLGAHYTQLVLMSDAHEMLVSFHQLVEEQVHLYSALQKLEGFLTHYKKHQPLPKTEHIGLYSVEMLEL